MQSSKSPSFFQDLKKRELNGFRVRKRPSLSNLESESGGRDAGVVVMEHEGVTTPPLAVSFGKTSGNSHFLAVSDEDGYISFFDTRQKLPSYASYQQNAAPADAKVCGWVAHHNAIFDICWMKRDTDILTASGDQTIKIWDTEKKKCIGIMMGHTGSVKSLCSQPSNPDLFIFASRDGSFALWDLRCNSSSKSYCGASFLHPTSIVRGAHASLQGKKVRRGKASSMSITSVLYLNDGISIASAGAVGSIVKFWDTRNLKAPVTQAGPHFEPSAEKERMPHGISSLSQDSNGVFLAASCMDNSIYLYNILRLENGPIKTFSCSRIESFHVKSAISPDAARILGGCSDGNAYIWQVKSPDVGPVTLKGHEGEVTAVDWCSSEIGKIATSSDDFMVRIWNIQKGTCSNAKSPSSIRRRVTAIPAIQGRKLVIDERPRDFTMTKCCLSPPEDTSIDHQSATQTKILEFSTPESTKKRRSSDFFLNEGLEMQKTPEVALQSPSSVLNPPPSLNRAIRDYFVATS